MLVAQSIFLSPDRPHMTLKGGSSQLQLRGFVLRLSRTEQIAILDLLILRL